MGRELIPYRYYESVYDNEVTDEELSRFGDELQSSLDISEGHLINVGKVTDSSKSYLIIVMHHLITDGVTWRIVLEDLCQSITAIEKGEAFADIEKYSSYRAYSEELENNSEITEKR